MRFQDSIFWRHYKDYKTIVGNSSTRSTIDGAIYWKLINEYKPKRILEVGVFQGLTSGLLLEASNTASLLGIDPALKLNVFDKVYPNSIKNRGMFLEKKIQDVVLEGEFDFILIDGDHEFESAYADLLQCIPYLSKDGILAIDDYSGQGVNKAILKMTAKKFGLVPFLQLEQTEFWHYPNIDRSTFLDGLLSDSLSRIIIFYNIERLGYTVLKAKTVEALTDNIDLFDTALKIYNV